MAIDRPVEHRTFPNYLQTHKQSRPGLDLLDPQTFDNFLRISALYSRGLVVTDSDLNNNTIFHNAAELSGSLFWPAIRTGFIRRAAREDLNGNRPTQTEVSEGLQRSSKARFQRIPAGHPARLDKLFAEAEEAEEPLIWTLHSVNQAFAARLLAMLQNAPIRNSRDAAEIDMMEEIEAWVRSRRDDGTPFGAADIETSLKPSGSEKLAAWNAVWPIVLESHGGNIPLVFEGQLALTNVPEATDRLLPAGPESGLKETDLESTIYNSVLHSTEGNLRFEVRQGATEPADHVFRINQSRLSELSLEHIEELRETAEPATFLQRRFRTGGSGEQRAALADSLHEAAYTYHERLAAAGLLLTSRAERTALKSDLLAMRSQRAEARQGDTQVVAIHETHDRAVEFMMAASSPLPLLGPQVVMCDFNRLVSAVGRQAAQSFFGGDNAYYWLYKRPDYRVLERLAADDQEHRSS